MFVIMPSLKECLCCQEIAEVVNKMSMNTVAMQCITEHPGFTTVCLDVWVLQTAYFSIDSSMECNVGKISK